MNTLFFRTVAPLIVAIMLIFSVYICLRGHNEPGGGFIGGLIAASAIAVYAMAAGVTVVRRALQVDPIAIAGGGVMMAGLSGLSGLFTQAPFLTSVWLPVELGDGILTLSTPMIFDIGVYLTVFGTLSALALALEGEGEEDL